MTPTDKLSEIDNPLERIDELTAERDRFGDRIDDLAAEVIRLRAENADLLAGADADAMTISNLVAANALLVTDRTALEAQLAAADRLADDICPVSDFVGLSGSDFAQSHPKLNAALDDGCREDWAEDLAWVIYDALAAYRAIRGGV